MTDLTNDHAPLRFITCGSVDDGKSTLIGRLLYDTRAILSDVLASVAQASRRRGLAVEDLSLLTDGLSAEREQGITIDVAYRYFSTGRRKFIVADSPGHEQYTRNMITAASTASLAIVLIDARQGVTRQTRRHTLLAHLLGIHRVVVAVNKMDLVDYDAAAFERIRTEGRDLMAQLGGLEADFVPMSALHGDMIVTRGDKLGWYDGPTLLEILESAPAGHEARDTRFRMPVQYVCRPRRAGDAALHDYRGYMGRIESGTLTLGERIGVYPSGRTSLVTGLEVSGRPALSAHAGQSVTVQIEDDLDISRGDLLAGPDAAPRIGDGIEADLCWLSETDFNPCRTYLLRHAAQTVRARLEGIDFRLDVATLARTGGETLAMNDIGRARLRLSQAIGIDRYVENRATGAFILIDEASNDTVAAGMVL